MIPLFPLFFFILKEDLISASLYSIIYTGESYNFYLLTELRQKTLKKTCRINIYIVKK